MPETNLNNEEPSSLCRLATVGPGHTWWKFVATTFGSTLQTSFEVGGCAFLNHNLSVSSKVRLILDDDFLPDPEILYPTSTESSTNFTGNHTAVDDDPFGGGVDSMTTTTPGSASQARFGFATPAVAPETGADLQAFYIRVAGAGSGTGAIDIELYESAVLVATLSSAQTITAGVDTVIQATWNASLLGTASGANIELRINNPSPGGSFGLTIKAVQLVIEPNLTSPLYDTGWIDGHPTTIDDAWGGTSPITAGRAPTQNFVHIPAAVVEGAFAGRFMVRDITNTDGYIQAGILMVGPIFQPAINRSYGDLIGIKDLSVKKHTHGGQTFGVKRPRLRTVSLPFSDLTTTEAHSLYDRLYWRKGTLSPVLVSLFPDDATEGPNTTVYCTPEQLGPMGAPDASGRRAMTMDFIEKL